MTISAALTLALWNGKENAVVASRTCRGYVQRCSAMGSGLKLDTGAGFDRMSGSALFRYGKRIETRNAVGSATPICVQRCSAMGSGLKPDARSLLTSLRSSALFRYGKRIETQHSQLHQRGLRSALFRYGKRIETTRDKRLFTPLRSALESGLETTGFKGLWPLIGEA